MTDLPSRLHATPAEHAIAQTVEDVAVVRAAADNEGLYYRDRVDPDQNGPYPVKLIEFPA